MYKPPNIYSCFVILIVAFLSVASAVTGQEVVAYKPEVTRILFILDGSGSMKEKWDGQTKFEIAKDLLVHLVDSIGQNNPNVQFGVRVFGHQYPRSMNNCDDSNLEVPFASENARRIKTVLDGFKPQGHTPIAYSLFLAAQDFPDDMISTNAIILITDGKENCEGNPCAASQLLEKKRISLRPFIIGLNLGVDLAINFDCVGRFFDAKDKASFNNVVDVVVSQALNTTTAQINLIDKKGQPTITNLPLTLYDHYSGEIRYNFIHTLNAAAGPDTLYLDPVGKYDIEVHTIPPVVKLGIELVPGKHNIIGIDVLKGLLDIEIPKERINSDAQTVVREANSPSIMFMHDMKHSMDYISGDYDYEVLTLPRLNYRSEFLPAEETRRFEIPPAGTLNLLVREPGIASIHMVVDEIYEMVFEFKKITKREALKLQPGLYHVVYRPNNDRKADLTKTKEFEISSGKSTFVRF